VALPPYRRRLPPWWRRIIRRIPPSRYRELYNRHTWHYAHPKPTIIKPFFGDQAFWAERVESLNVGSAVRKLTSEALAEALVKATTDEKQIAKAKVVGEMIRKENGVSRAIEAIYRDLVCFASCPLTFHSETIIPQYGRNVWDKG
jgi:hypothetical protein